LTITEKHTIVDAHCVCLTVPTSILRITGYYVESCVYQNSECVYQKPLRNVDELKQRLIKTRSVTNPAECHWASWS